MNHHTGHPVVVVGAGPAGLMAAETIAAAGVRAIVLERMPSVGRKFLMAGRGGLNLTHSEPIEALLDRYGTARAVLAPHILAHPPAAVVAWCEGLGQPTFVGTSGRVFPVAMKASPLLRAWLRRLAGLGVEIRTRTEWTGWEADGAVRVAGAPPIPARATVLALGGASWPRLGSDGAWTHLLGDVAIAPLRPANCGFRADWSPVLVQRCAGLPLKRAALHFAGRTWRGEAMLTETGLEGGLMYAAAAVLRDAIAGGGPVSVTLDLRPDLSLADVARRAAAQGSRSAAGTLHALGVSGAAAGLVQEALHARGPAPLAALVKSCPVTLTAPLGLDRAISTAGGIAWTEVDATLQLHRRPGVFVAGEMLDWEAPTGGYLLQACLGTGVAAGRAAALTAS